jgi:hypothetical protein
MEKIDEVALRCPHCGSLAAGRVNREERRAGTAKLQCIVCKRTLSVPKPEPYMQELGRTLRLYGLALRNMGWIMVVLLLAFWVVGGYMAVTRLGWPSWLAFLAPGIPFMYFFARAFAPLMRAQVRGELGVMRIPGGYRGLTERDALVVRSPAELEKVIAAKNCPKCNGKLSAGEHRLVLPKQGGASLRFRLFGRATRMFEKVDVDCKQCGAHGSLYFDISTFDVVKKYGFTPELLRHYPKKKS